MSAGTNISELSLDELNAIACDLNHPLRADASELLDEWQADESARYTPAGGEA